MKEFATRQGLPIRRMESDDATRKFYEAHAEAYAEATRDRVLSDVLEEFSARIETGRVLDLGCGAGHDLAAFSARGHAAVGLDYAAPIAKIAHLASLAPIVVADMRALPFAAGIFDGVWASASLLHLPRSDLIPALQEAKRVLRPAGLLFASLKTGSGNFRDKDGRFFTLFERKNWERSLAAAGFMPVSTTCNQGVRPTGRRGPQRWIASLAVSA